MSHAGRLRCSTKYDRLKKYRQEKKLLTDSLGSFRECDWYNNAATSRQLKIIINVVFIEELTPRKQEK